MSTETASLNYLSLGIGFIIGLQITSPLLDKSYAWFKSYYKTEEGVPEWRVPPMLIGGIFTPLGLIMYGWTAQYHIHWIVPNMGCMIFAIGPIIAFQCSQAYIVDAYGKLSASASAAGAFLRTIYGFGMPLFAPAMYHKLGLGWGNSMLAFVTLGLAIPSPILLWFYGHKLRKWSPYVPV
jgi:hypothetical protein